MRKHLIFVAISIYFIPVVTQGQVPSMSLDWIQERLFGVSTLKGVQEVYPQVQIEILKQDATELSSSSKIETLVRNDIQQQVIQALEKADIQIAQNFDIASEKAPLSLNTTVFIKITNTASPIYHTYIYTEALQPIILSRDSSIRSLSRTWPMIPAGLYNRNMLVLTPQTLEKEVKSEINKQKNYFISDYLTANPRAVSRSATGVDIAALRKTLFEETPELRGTFRVRDNNPQLQAIRQLDSAGSEEAINVLLEFLTNNGMDCKLKQYALISLGKIGTESAIDAIKKFEEWSQKRYSEPLPFNMGLQEYAIDHFASSDVQPLAQATDFKNKTWAIIMLRRYEKLDLFLTSLIKDNQWSEPILLTIPGLSELQRSSEINWKLHVEGDLIRIEKNDSTYETKISEQVIDVDKDGLPDNVEARFLTYLNNPDSDGDGVSDGQDSNPLTPKHKATNDTIEIRQAVFSILFATNNNRGAIVVVDRDEFAKQEYYGFGGAVLRSPKSRDGFVNVTSIDIRYQSGDAATVNISDWEGSLAASIHEAKLKKIHGKWIVIDFRLTLIS